MIHTNTVEGYFAIFKRGMRGTYQRCKEKHLHRYLSEFDSGAPRASNSPIEHQLVGPNPKMKPSRHRRSDKSAQVSYNRGMPKEPELSPKEQFKRFVETTHEHGVDESGKEWSGRLRS